MGSRRKQMVIADLRGGVNQIDPPIASGPQDRLMRDARNIEFFAGGLCQKRQGCAEPTGLTYSATSGKIASLFRHVNRSAENDTELWMVTDGGGLGRMVDSSLTCANVAPGDALTTAQVQHAEGVSFDGMLFIAAKSAADRLHVWDGTVYRRAGLATTATAPTTGTGAGTVTDTRKYKVTYAKKTGSLYDVRSEPSAATGAVSLSTQKCTVTKNASPGDSETHWELWGASVDSSYTIYYKLGEAVIGTSTIDDNNADITLPYGEILQDLGENYVPKSAKHIIADENRLLFANSWENEIYASRVWYTPVLGATDVGDAERVPEVTATGTKNYIDVNRGVGGGITGLGGPLYDAIYVFKMGSIFKLVKTGVPTSPYRVVSVNDRIGCIEAKTIVNGEDQAGNPCIYFLSRRGPYRLGSNGLEYIGADIETTWGTVNQDATTMVAHGVYYHEKHQVWWWMATGASNVPNGLIIFDVQRGQQTELGVRGGWTIYDSAITEAFCSVMYSKDLGVTNASFELKPYFGSATVADTLVRCDEPDVYTDYDGAGYLSYFRTRGYAIGGFDRTVGITGASVVADPDDTDSPCLWLRAERNWNTNWAEYHLSIPPSDKDRVLVEQKEPTSVRQGPAASDVVSIYVYDNADQQVGWKLDAVVLEYGADGER